MLNVAIDGPAGAGKSTIAKEIAKRLKFVYVDTGAMFRAMALACLRRNIDSSDEDSIEKICNDVTVTIKYLNNEQCVFLDQENVNSLIRSEDVSRMTSIISVYKAVRNKLLILQRDLAKNENVIMDGRDIGTYVLPNADVKIYLTASARIRAERRYDQIKESNPTVTIWEIEEDIKERDNRDMHREIAPLKQANDAVYFDTSDFTIDEVIDKIINIIKEKTGIE